jgi:hypothetical protein
LRRSMPGCNITVEWVLFLGRVSGPWGSRVKHAFSGIGKRTFPSCPDVLARCSTLS